MDKKMVMIISISIAIGFLAGGFVGGGVFYAVKPAPQAPTTYTLTIANYRETGTGYFLNWTPSKVASTHTNGTGIQFASIVFEENTRVYLMTPNGYFDPWRGPDADEVVWVNNHLSWIQMNRSKVIEVRWD